MKSIDYKTINNNQDTNNQYNIKDAILVLIWLLLVIANIVFGIASYWNFSKYKDQLDTSEDLARKIEEDSKQYIQASNELEQENNNKSKSI